MLGGVGQMLLNSRAGFGLVAIVLHWLSALMVVGLFAGGLWMVGLHYYDPWYVKAPFWHKSTGVCFFCLVVLRLLWRLLSHVPAFEVTVSPWERIVARAVQYVFYALMLCIPPTGYLIATAEGHAVDVLGWFSIPAIVEFDNSSDLMSDIHGFLAWLLIILAVIHAAAALKHHFIDKDKTLLKMLMIKQGEKNE